MAYSVGLPVGKGEEFLLVFPVFNSYGELQTGCAGWTCVITKDGAAPVALTNSPSEIGTIGLYKVTLTASETNCDVFGLVLTPSSPVDASATPRIVYTSNAQFDDLMTLGTGATSWTYTLRDDVSALPIADATVWVSTDSVGTNIVARGTTDQNGQITFQLDDGTVYVWSAKSGYTFVNPDTEVVS